jgi:hypothetical protein
MAPPGFRKSIGLLVLLLIVPAPFAHAKDQTRVFQQGLSGYSGVRDPFISASGWDTPPQYTRNYGQNERLLLTRDGQDNPLRRFDVTSIPAHSAVLSATLLLYNTTPRARGAAQAAVRRGALSCSRGNARQSARVPGHTAGVLLQPGNHPGTGFSSTTPETTGRPKAVTLRLSMTGAMRN